MVYNLFKAYIKFCICQKIKNISSLQRRKKSEKSGFLTGNSAMLGKKFPTNAVGNKPESAPDPLLSLFINNNMHFLDPKCIQQDECFRDDASDTSDVKRYTPFWSKLWYVGLISSIRNCNVKTIYILRHNSELQH